MSSSNEILVTEGRSGASRAALAAVRSLGRSGFSPVVTVANRRMSYAGTSKYATRIIEVPNIDFDREGYMATINEVLKSFNFMAVLPASDASLLALRPELNRYVDKQSMAVLARESGLETPPTKVLTDDELRRSGAELDYPVVVKPSLKSTLARLVRNQGDLEHIPRGTKATWLVQPFLGDEQMRGLIGLMWNGRLVGATHLRYRNLWPLPVGTIASAITTEPDWALEDKVQHLLREYSGVFHMDLAGPYLLDLNPRIHASLAVAAAAGSDLVTRYAMILNGEESEQIERGKPGFLFRWLEADIRNIVSGMFSSRISVGVALRQLVPRSQTVHSVWSVSDPIPLLARVWQTRNRLSDRSQTPLDRGRSLGG